MDLAGAALLFAAGAVGGALNSVAGGGSFIVFPTMLLAGVPPVAANATTTVTLWPAGIASAAAYRDHLPRERGFTLMLALMSLLGGGLGAKLLLVTSDETFVRLLPWLLLLAAVVFTFGPRLSKGSPRKLPLPAGALLQLFIAGYGGYFGGGMGIMMLATFTLLGMTHMHAMNGLKAVLGALINGVAVVAFFVAGKVVLGAAAPAVVGAIAGGFAGAAIARRIDPKKVRIGVLVFAWALTIWFFYRALLK